MNSDSTKVSMPKFQVWKTIKLGTGLKNAEAFRKTFESEELPFDIDRLANEILNDPSFVVAATETEVDLARVSVKEFNLTSRPQYEQYKHYEDICARAFEQGLQLCPIEVGPQLRLQYTDQPFGELIYIAMKPVDEYAIFGIGRNAKLVLLGEDKGRPDSLYDDFERLVFVLPRA